MPNWCYNNVKISFDSENEQELRDKVRFDKDLFCQFAPMPESVGDGWYEWNISNWGTKWDAQPFDINWEDDCVTFQLETAWSPPVGFYEKMEELGYDIEAYYLEEGMAFCGQYMDGNDDYYEYGGMLAGDMENDLPEWVEDKFGLITRTRDDEAEREDEDDEEDYLYEPAQYTEDEKTDWFKGKLKPVHAGLYEVKTKSWPYPHVMSWDNKKWCVRELDVETASPVIEWRGLKTNV